MKNLNQQITYDELRKLAIKEGVADNKVSIGIWAKLKGYIKIKREIRNNKFVWVYTKKNG